MRKLLFRRMASVALSSALAISAMSAGGIGSVEAAEGDKLTLKASELNAEAASGGGTYINEDYKLKVSNGSSEVELILDEDIHLGDCDIYGNTTISGSKTLSLDQDSSGTDMNIYGDLTVKSGAKIELNSHDTDIFINTYNGAGGNLYSWGDFIFTEGYQICAHGDVYIYDGNFDGTMVETCFIYSLKSLYVEGGNFKTHNTESIFCTDNDIFISGGTIDCTIIEEGFKCFYDGKINISGGDINIEADDYPVIYTCGGDVSISGGNLVVSTSSSRAVDCNNFAFSGGYLEMNVPNNYTNVLATSFDMAENCYIDQPEGGAFDSNENTILDSEGKYPAKVVLKECYDLSKVKISGIEDKAYTGSAIIQNAVVSFNGHTLEEGTDYVVEYSNNKDAGTATMTFKPAEGSKTIGTVSKTFQITKSDKDDKKDDDKKDDDQKDDKKDDQKDNKKYSNEWVDGKWYDADGKQTYKGTMSWKSNDKGWWIEDSEGWYPQSQWQKIDGKWYYFCADGYMDYSEYRDGCWLGSDGAWVEEYHGGTWKQNSTGWWYEDASGWYPHSQWVWIDGSCYYFGADGYMLTNQYVDGYWIGSDGVCQ